MIELCVTREEARSRLDVFLASKLPAYSRSRLQALIRDGLVRLNAKVVRPSEIVRAGDAVTLEEPEPEEIDAAPEDIPLDVLFEDDDLIVLNKPAGLVMHPGAGNQEHTLVNALLHHCATLSGIGGKLRPGIVHRLDKETSGCVLVAKNDLAHRALAQQFAARSMLKIYLALVSGRMKKSAGTIDALIARHRVHRQKMAVTSGRGRTARTDYRVLASSPAATLVECTLHSGRTHQIRVHLQHLGHAVLGDKMYAAKNAKLHPRQMLHAWKIGFHHPRTGEWKEFAAPLPSDFATAAHEAIGDLPAGISSLFPPQ